MLKICPALGLMGALGACAAVERPAAPGTQAAPPAPAAASIPCFQRPNDGNWISRIQQEAETLIARLEADPDYGWAAYQHAPCYRLLLAVTDGQPRQWVLAAASPALRPYITFVKAEQSFAEREQASREIRAALGTTGVKALFASSGNDESFQVIVRTQADAERVLRAIPARYRSMTVVRLGYVEPRPE